jgi:hypothetical protein
MVATDSLSPQQFFHGTDAEFKVGDMVEPRKPRVGGTRYAYTYLSKDPGRSATYGPRVYEVAPTDEVRRDPHGPGSSYRSRSALRVVREVPDPPQTPKEEL